MSSNATLERPKSATLPAKRVAWVKENARPATADCLCGCGEKTKSRFVPGHDARLRRALEATAAAGGPTARAAKEALRRFNWL